MLSRGCAPPRRSGDTDVSRTEGLPVGQGQKVPFHIHQLAPVRRYPLFGGRSEPDVAVRDSTKRAQQERSLA